MRDQFKFYRVRHEEVASLAAAGYTKLTGKIGVGIESRWPWFNSFIKWYV